MTSLQPLYFGTSQEQFPTSYPKYKNLFTPGKTISSQLPKNVVKIRNITAIALTAFFAMICPIGWRWPVILMGAAFVGWTYYSNHIRKDPLVEAFYKIVGSKTKYDALPEMQLRPDRPLSEQLEMFWKEEKAEEVVYIGKKKEMSTEAILELKNQWDHFPRACRSQMPDGRKILVLKALSNAIDKDAKARSLFVLVEKLSAKDVWGTEKVKPLFALALFNKILKKDAPLYKNSKWFKENRPTSVSTCTLHETYKYIAREISTDLANEFAGQLQSPDKETDSPRIEELSSVRGVPSVYKDESKTTAKPKPRDLNPLHLLGISKAPIQKSPPFDSHKEIPTPIPDFPRVEELPPDNYDEVD